MYGIADLAKHLLFLAKKEGYSESDFKKTSFVKVVFVAFAYTLKFNLDIRYDILFIKNSHGVTSDDVQRILNSDIFGRNISFEKAKELSELTSHEKFNLVVLDLIKEEKETLFSVVGRIINSDVFRQSEYNQLDEGTKRYYDTAATYYKYDSIIWNMEEIYLFLDLPVDPNGKYGVPLDQDEFEAISKLFELKELSLDDENSVMAFTLADIRILKKVSDSILESVEKHGAFVK